MLVYEKNSGWKVGPVSEGENIVTLTPDMVTEIFFFIMSKPDYKSNIKSLWFTKKDS